MKKIELEYKFDQAGVLHNRKVMYTLVHQPAAVIYSDFVVLFMASLSFLKSIRRDSMGDILPLVSLT